MTRELTLTAGGTVSGLIERWAHMYNQSKAVGTTVTYLHFAGMLLAGGFAVVADREAFRLSPGAASEAPQELAKLAEIHVWVVAGLAVVVVSGLLMMLADLHTYLASTVFWTKMGLFVLLVANGYGRMRAERTLGTGDGTGAAGVAWLRRTSVASVVLWFAVLLVSTMLNASS